MSRCTSPWMSRTRGAARQIPSRSSTFTSSPDAASRPIRELKGFSRVRLAAHAHQTLHFTVTPQDLRYWSAADHAWVQDAADFDLWGRIGLRGDAARQLPANRSALIASCLPNDTLQENRAKYPPQSADNENALAVSFPS